ncbi:hypothetical protein PR001_g6311 [Phytophthora rubi]|uniref:RRM domain-containing protein n=1 Tax=Phytophthora rubi TaxID=129364 RepID=A0A6A3NTA2_9STRA|nr:hypothetical protein PR001_g6311 [Phytophthora rubi]KAE9043669.1 hypothetical protein PR002_g3215 [Phytophthora rubi]
MTANAPADERFSLRVRNLPAVLSSEAITSLLSHYGASRVRVLQRRNVASSGKEPGAAAPKKLQKAVATFASREAQQNAQRRLQRMELAGHYLQVEVVGDEAATTSTETQPEAVETGHTLPLKGQPPLPKGLPPPLPPTPAPVQNPLYAPVPLAPHLGLHYAPSPLLEYKYPKATESIVRNIANALIALPRFYTQVLHLMNKMNLPPPFEVDAIPGRFSARPEATEKGSGIAGARRPNRKRPRTGESLHEQIVEEEEDEEENGGVQDAVKEDTTASETHPTQLPQSSERTNAKSSVAFRPSSSGPSIATKDNDSRSELIGKPLVRQNKLLTIKKNAALNGAFQLGAESRSNHGTHQLARPGVISKNELDRQRVPPKDLLKEPLLASYSRGSPSNVVLAKNIARGVDEKDLRFVFGYVLPLNSTLDSVKIRLSAAMSSALVTYPDEAIATAAVDEFHGLQLEGQTLIVSFQHALPESRKVMPAVQPWSLEQLASKRLPDAELSAEKVMNKYQRGEPSDTLYVKNLAKTVELSDLLAVFSAVIPPESGPEFLNIRHFTEGTMKCQAFVKYPTVELASSALLQVHGVVLKDKPLIVCFRKP